MTTAFQRRIAGTVGRFVRHFGAQEIRLKIFGDPSESGIGVSEPSERSVGVKGWELSSATFFERTGITREGDATFWLSRLPEHWTSGRPQRPRSGDHVTFDGVTYVIVKCHAGAAAQRWLLDCRSQG